MRNSIPAIARAILFGLLLLIPLVFTGRTLEAFETPKVALLQTGALALAALTIVSRTESSPPRRLDPITWGLILFTASATISTLTSLSPRASFFGGIESFAGLTTVLAFAAIYFAVREFVTSPNQVRRLLLAPVIATGLVAGYAVVQVLRLDPYPWGASSSVGGFVRPFSTLAHANMLGGYLVTALPLVILAAVVSQGKARIAAIGVSILAVAAIALSLTRGAWLTLAVLAFMAAVLAFRGGDRRSIGWAAFGSVVIAVVGWFAAGAAFRNSIVERFANATQSAGRIHLWRAGVSMAVANPILGVGLDAFPLAFGEHRTTEYWLTERNTTPTRAHNEIVQVLATQGVIGLLAITATVIAIIIAVWRTLRAGKNRSLTLALAASLFAFAFQNLFSFTVAATGSLAVVLAGILSREAQCLAAPALNPSPRWRFRVAIAGVAAVLAWIGVVEPLLADMECRSAECLAVRDPIRALAGFESAVARFPERDLLWFKLSQGARAAARVTDDPARRYQWNERAREAQQMAVDLVPEHPGHRAHFARLLLDLKQEGQSSDTDMMLAFRAALERDPRNPSLHAEAGMAAWAAGQAPDAKRFLVRGMELDPNQANLRALAGMVAMGEGHFEEAEQQLHEASKRDWHNNENGHLQALTVWAGCLVRLNRPAQAESLARTVLLKRPDWPGPRYTLGYSLAMMGRRPEAEIEYRELITRTPDHPLAGEAKKHLATAQRK
jgi:O-antigen ligase/Flp pilus assembly protein TadD